MCGRGNECQDFWKLSKFLFYVCNVEFTEACRTGSVEEAENLKAALSLDEVKKIVNQHSSQESLLFRYLTSFFCLMAHLNCRRRTRIRIWTRILVQYRSREYGSESVSGNVNEP